VGNKKISNRGGEHVDGKTEGGGKKRKAARKNTWGAHGFKRGAPPWGKAGLGLGNATTAVKKKKTFTLPKNGFKLEGKGTRSPVHRKGGGVKKDGEGGRLTLRTCEKKGGERKKGKGVGGANVEGVTTERSG